MISKILLTGAAGALGTVLREPLSKLCTELVSTDLNPAKTELMPNETWATADMALMDQVKPLLQDVEMVAHFASRADEGPFEDILGSNYISAYNVWESAYHAGTRRIVYASSVHGVGMYRANEGIGLDAPHRPDTFYGLAKAFTEDLAKMYWEKRGLECVSMRIFSCTPEPQNARALSTWLSHGDLIRMTTAAITSRTVGYTNVFGISANTRSPVDNTMASFLGYVPQDNAEDWAKPLMAAADQADPSDLAQMCLGGPFATIPLGESGVAAIKKMNKK
jgi:uronate dehydrogenase